VENRISRLHRPQLRLQLQLQLLPVRKGASSTVMDVKVFVEFSVWLKYQGNTIDVHLEL